jgi:hypothetical protein
MKLSNPSLVNRSGVVTWVLLLLLAACQQAVRPPIASTVPPAASAAWDAYVSEFLESYFVAQPGVGVWAGRHEFDGTLPDWSAAGIKREIQRLHAERDRAAAFPNEAIDARQRFERDYLISRIDRDLFWQESLEWPFRSPAYYGFALEPDVYVARPYAPLAERLRAYTRYARSIPVAAGQIRTNLRTPLPRTYIQIGHIVFGGLASFYETDAPGIFAAVADAQLQAEFRAANAGAIKAMKDLDAWFTQQEAGATDAFALGADKFAEMLRSTERVDVPLAQLKTIAERDLQRNLAALRDSCAAFAVGQDIAACITKMQANKAPGSPVDAARTQLAGLRAFVENKRLVSIPGSEQADVEESPPYARWNMAQIRIPGPYEKNLPSVYQIAPPDPKWTLAERDAYIPARADLLFISAHEVWPGHFLQFMHARRSSSKLGQVFTSYAFNEGWAHYSEEMMWEAGLGDGDPETHIGQLVNALLRNVRLLSAIGLHTGTMTVAESERMFLEQAYQSAGSARQQAARGTFDPGYGNYTIGKLMIRKLREDWTATRGGRAAWKDFHDELLKYGSPPIPLVRKAMLGGDAGSLF